MEAFRTEIDPISDEKRDPVVVLLRTADFALGDRGLSTVASLSLSLSLYFTFRINEVCMIIEAPVASKRPQRLSGRSLLSTNAARTAVEEAEVKIKGLIIDPAEPSSYSGP
jgi:hypothetical protein